MKVGQKNNNVTQLEEAGEDLETQRLSAQSSKTQIGTVVKNGSFIMPPLSRAEQTLLGTISSTLYPHV